jgi:hypothetical protein
VLTPSRDGRACHCVYVVRMELGGALPSMVVQMVLGEQAAMVSAVSKVRTVYCCLACRWVPLLCANACPAGVHSEVGAVFSRGMGCDRRGLCMACNRLMGTTCERDDRAPVVIAKPSP